MIKANSSLWVHDTLGVPAFGWQDGYSAFTVSHERHHRTMTFQEEYAQFLEKHGIDYDERYVWG